MSRKLGVIARRAHAFGRGALTQMRTQFMDECVRERERRWMKDKTNDDAKKEGASTENLATPTRSQHFDGHQRAYGRKKVQHYSCYHTWALI